MGVHASLSILLISVLTLAFSRQVIDHPTPRRSRAANMAKDQNPESARTLTGPLAPARRTRRIVSPTKWTTPRCDDPSRRRAPTTSPVSARNANSG